MAKTAPAAAPAPARAKKRPTIAAAARRRRARRANPAPRMNPDGDLVGTFKTVGVGIGAYAGTRFAQRMAWTLTARRRPRWAKHVHAAAGVAVFAAAVLVGKRIRQLDGHLDAVLMGTGVAAAQGVVSAYIPKYAWMMNDCRADELALPAPASNPHEQLHAAAGPPDLDLLDRQLAQHERGARRTKAPVATALQTAAAADGSDLGLDPGLLEELGTEDIDDLYGGVFEDPTLSN